MNKKEYMQIMVLADEHLEECPEVVNILPVGRVRSEKGDFLVDRESFVCMKAEMRRRGIDIVVDYEHQTLKDVQAPAGGWVKELLYTDNAIQAKIEWTPKAKEYLKNKEYRYLSPVVLTRKKDGKAVVLHSLALTNTPAINGMFAIVNSVDADISQKLESTGGMKKMDLEKIKEMLELPEDTPEEEVMKALMERLKKADGAAGKEDQGGGSGSGKEELVANSVVLGLLELPENAKTEDVAGKIMALKAGADSREKEIENMLKRIQERDADDAVMAALKAGKITASQKDWAKAYALKDRTGFDSFVEKAPVVVPVGKLNIQDAPKAGGTEVDRIILKATGMTKEDIEKYADKEDED